MSTVVFKSFSGIAPRMVPRRLPAGMAQIASNVNLESRTLRPWKGLLDVQTGLTGADPSTIYRFGLSLTSDTQYWFHFTSDVDIIKTPVINDPTERTIYTSAAFSPRWTNSDLALTGGPPYPVNYRDLGVPAPTGACTVDVTGTGSGTSEARTYVYTNVTAYGEESAPSPASTIVTVSVSGQTVTLSGFSAAPTGTSSTTARRIYRSVTAASGQTNYYFVKEITSATSSTVDDVTGSGLGEPIATSGWLVPPSTMRGITAMANGIMLGFTGNDVCVSEAYIPYAWPAEYKLSTDYPIVGLKAIGNQAVVLTTGYPYMLTGTDPSSLSLTKLEWQQACVSKRSIVLVGGSVVFASPDGLCAIDSSGSLVNLTENLFTRTDWQALNPESIYGYLYNDKYFGFYNTGAVTGGFVFEPKASDAAFSFIDTYATAGYSDLVDDELFLKVGTKIQKWDATGNYTNFSWTSGIIQAPKPMNFGGAMVIATAYPVTFKLYADGALKHTETVASSTPFRLPGGYKGRDFEIELTGANEVEEVQLTSLLSELASV